MEEVLKINNLYRELLSRGHKNFTWLKIKNALDGEADGNLTKEEKLILKKLLLFLIKFVTDFPKLD